MITKHEKDYKTNAFEQYTMSELGQWVHLLTTRATHRTSSKKREKDLYDARNYLKMMDGKIAILESALKELSEVDT